MTGSGLVGRERPLAVVSSALDDLDRGIGGLVTITGEAGIGKTAILRAAVTEARRRGVMVGSGACRDGDAPGWWPWVQALRGLRSQVAAHEWAGVGRESGAALGGLLGDDVNGDPRTIAPAEVVGAVTTALRALARRRPVLVAVEDVHWADAASLDLLAALGRQVALDPVLVVATARADELGDDDPRHEVLAALPLTISLSGLDVSAVAELLERHGAATMGDAAEVCRRTGGNPFFVEQLARLWTASGATSTPRGIGATVERRLARLPSETVDLLSVAAVSGDDVDVALVAAVAGLDTATAVQRLRPAVDARLLLGDLASRPPAPSSNPVVSGDGRPRFAHAIVREVLVDRLDPSRARRLHAAVVEHLPAVAGDDPQLAGRLAGHAVQALPDVPARDAAALSVAAARQASRRLAADEAARHLRRALELLPDATATAELRVELATQLRRAGRLDAARAELHGVLDAAAAAGHVTTHAHAALGLHELGALLGDVEHDRQLATLESSLRLLEASGSPDDALRARVMAAIGRTHAHRLDDERRGVGDTTAAAVDIARRSGDDAALAFCLLARHDAVWGIVAPAERVVLVREMADAARRAGEVELELQAALLQFVVQLELADPGAIATLDRYAVLAERCGLARARYLVRSRRTTVATMQGRFAEAEVSADAALALGASVGETDTISVDVDQRWELARLRGDLAAIELAVATFDEPHLVVHEITVAVDRADAVRTAELHDAVERLDVRWPRWAATIWLAIDAEVAVLLGDLDRCRRLRERIAAHGAAWVVLGGGVVTHGPTARLLGMLDVALGEWDRAVVELEQARRLAERMGARPWVVLTRLSLVEALLGRAGPGDRDDAAGTLDAARREAAELGMATAMRRADELAARRHDAAPTANRFVREGAVWTVEFAGRVQRLPASKGLRDLHELLARPRRDVAAAELQALDGAAPARAARGDPVLDDEAKAAFRRRLTQLDAAIEQALDRHDDRRAAALDGERDALLRELRTQTGLGGRARRTGDDVERARKAVTARLRDAIARLAARDPGLGAHLDASITTGTMCRYDPPTDLTWHT